MKPLFGFVTLTLLLCSSMVVGQTGQGTSIGYPALHEVSYNYYGGSARAMAMGYAFVGLSDDVSSGLWNPAGLWVLEGPMVSASYNLYSPAGEFADRQSPIRTKNDLSMSAIGHFSFVAPVRIKGHPWVFSFNYDRNNEFSDKSAWVSSLTSGLNPDAYDEERRYQRTFNIGGSTRIFNQLSMGFTLNIIDASRVIDETRLHFTTVIVDPVYNITADGIRESRTIDSTKSNGFNFNLGLMFKEDRFSIGAVVHTPFTIRHTTDRTFDTLTTLNSLVDMDHTTTAYIVDSLAKQDIPLSVSLGAAFFPNEKLTLTLDMTFQNYGSTKWYYNTLRFFEPNGERTDSYEKIPIDWNNTFGVGIGGEYLVDSKFGQIPLRAGFRFDQLPQPANYTFVSTNIGYRLDEADTLVAYELPTITTTRTAQDRQSTTSISLGTGIHWSQIEIDIAYMYTSGAELTLTEQSYMYDEDSDGNPIAISENKVRNWGWKAHEFRFTFTGRF